MRKSLARGGRSVVVLLCLALLGAGCSSAANEIQPSPSAASPSPPVPASGSASGCGDSAPRRAPEGPTATATPARGGDEDAVQVDLVRYPRPDGEGDPWSHWGQGLVLEDGRMLSAMGNHLGADGNSYLFVYDATTRSLTRFADVRSHVGDALDWGYGKIHGQIVAGRCGEAYLATYWGTRKGLAYTAGYTGDLLLRLDTSSLELEPLGVPVPQHGIPSLAGSPGSGLLFGEAVDPTSDQRQGDTGEFFVYDTAAREVVLRSDDERHRGFRNVMVDGDGTAYLAAEGGTLLTYEPGASQLREHTAVLPGGGTLRASTAPAADGTVYGVTEDPAQLFALSPDGDIASLGEAWGYTASIAATPDGSSLYYVPDAHGTDPSLGTPVVQVDTATGEQTTLVRLDDVVADTLGLRTSGSYSVVLDAPNGRLYVTLNAGPTADDRWGEVVLAVVEVPASTTSAAASTCRAEPGGTLAAAYRAPTSGSPEPLRLVDATDAWGAAAPLAGLRGHAVATADVDGDGWTDLFVGTFADRPDDDYRHRGAEGPAPDRLLLGGPQGFRLDTSFPEERGRTSGAAFGDLDGDGDPDLVVARNVRDSERGRAPSRVLRNDGGRFTPVATLPEPVGARSVGLLDYDGDGLLDLMIAEDRFSGGSSVLLRNEADFAFTDVTEDAGLGRGVAGLGVGTGDLSGDGRPDLLVGGSNRLFVNEGGGRFSEQVGAIAAWPTFGDEDDPAGVAEGDLNADGRLDVVIGQHFNSTVDDGRRVPVRLYLNEEAPDGSLRLRDVTDEAGLPGLPTKSPHVQVVDLDLDGRPDILTTASGASGQPVVLRNTGGRVPRFEATSAPGPTQYWVTGAVLDADHDGRPDVVMVEWEPTLPTLLLRNAAGVGHWLGLSAPPGTSVRVVEAGTLGGDGPPLARATTGVSTGYSAGPEPGVWLGLGPVDEVDVSIETPSAPATELRGVRSDQWLVCRP